MLPIGIHSEHGNTQLSPLGRSQARSGKRGPIGGPWAPMGLAWIFGLIGPWNLVMGRAHAED